MLGRFHQMGMIPPRVAFINGRQRARKQSHLLLPLFMPRALLFSNKNNNNKKKIDCDPLSMGQMTEHNLLCYYRLAGDIFFVLFYLLQT